MWKHKVDEWFPRAWGGGDGEWGVTANVYGVSFWGGKNVLVLDCDIAQLWEYTKKPLKRTLHSTLWYVNYISVKFIF